MELLAIILVIAVLVWGFWMIVPGSDSGEVLRSVTILSTSGFQSVGQWRIAGIAPFATPEPSALEGLLPGTGMLGLAEMTRRKLRLGT